MKSKPRRLWVTCLLAVLLILLFSHAAFAADSGTCGSCSWKVANGTLTIYPTSGSSCTLADTKDGGYVPAWTDRTDVTRVVVNQTVKAGNTAELMFDGMKNLTDISGLSRLDVSNTTSMVYMFCNCDSLTNLTGLGNWNVSNVTDMHAMFLSCDSLTNLTALSNWNVSKVTNMGSMFYGCDSLTNLTGLEKWNVSKVTTMGSMFYECYSLTNLTALSNWNVSKVTNMGHMFYGCDDSLTNLTGLEKWNVSNVTKMEAMFYECESLTNLTALSNWNVSNVTNMCAMFKDCDSLTNLTGLENWNVSKVTTMSTMFSGCESLTNLTGLGNWNVSKVTNMGYMFNGCNSLVDVIPLKSWILLDLTNVGSIFNGTSVMCQGRFADELSSSEIKTLCFNEGTITGLKTTVSGTSVTLAWNALANRKQYEIWRSTSATSGFAKLGTCYGTTANFTGLVAGTTYYYKVRAQLTNGQYSSFNSVVKAAIPAASVSGLKAVVSGTSVKLTWNALANRKQYEIWRSTSATSGFGKLGTCYGNSVNFSGLTAGTTYYYKVRAQMTNGTYSNYSAVVTAAIPSNVSVSGLKVTVSGTSVKLTWNALANRKQYEIWRSTSASSGFGKLGTCYGNSANFSGLTAGTTYYYKVRAQMTNGTYSNYSAVVTAAIPGNVSVNGLKATVSGTSVKLTWNALANRKQYEIWRSTSASSGFGKLGTCYGNSVNFSGLAAGTTYYYKVRAQMTNGTYSNYSAVVTAAIPASVSGLKATVSGTSVKLTWNALANRKQYEIWRSTSATTGYGKLGTCQGNTVNFSGLTAGTTYYYKVRAQMTNGTYSNYSAVVTAAIPGTVSVSGLKATVSGTSVKLTWNALANRKQYEIWRSTSASSGFGKLGTCYGNTVTFSGLTGGTTYYYKVRAQMTNGTYSNYSAVVTAAIPTSVSGLTATVSGTSVQLNWNALANRKQYEIWRSTSATSGFVKLGTCYGTTANFTGLNSGTTYYFKVRALLTNGQYSSYSTAVTAVILGRVTGVSVRDKSWSSVGISWDAVDGADGYEIEDSYENGHQVTRIYSTTNPGKDWLEVYGGTKHTFRVRAIAGTSNRGEYSSPVSITPALAAPSWNGSYNSVDKTITLTWYQGDADGHVIKVYRSGYRTSCKNYLTCCAYLLKTVTMVQEDLVTSKFTYKINPNYNYLFRIYAYNSYATADRSTNIILNHYFQSYSSSQTAFLPEAITTEECSEDGSTCTLSEKVCTETECTITSKVCVVVGDQKACADPVVTVVPILTETPTVVVMPEVREECSEDGSTCTVSEKVCTETECTVTSKVCVVEGEQKVCEEPVATVVPILTETPTVVVTPEVREECSEDGSTCTVSEKVCTETECTITSKVCVVVGDQKACADPVVTVVPVLTETTAATETPALTEEPVAEATATATPEAAVPTEEVSEECSEDGSTCTVYSKVCTGTECTITSKVCVVVGNQKACSDPVVTVVPVLTETPAVTETAPAAMEETTAEPAATEAVTTEPAATETATAEPTATEETTAEPAVTETASVEPDVTETATAEFSATETETAVPAATETAASEPAVTEEATAEPAVTETAPAEPAATETATAEPAVTEAATAESAVTEAATVEPAATEEATEEPAVTEAAPVEQAATEEVTAEPAAAEAAPVEPTPTEDLTIREISIEDLTEDTISFKALESYVIKPEKLKIVPEAADWAGLTFKLDDESVAVIKTTDIETIKTEGLTFNGLVPGSTKLHIRAGDVEKTVTLVITLSDADIQATLEAEAAAQAAAAEPTPEPAAE